jgi:hypothetical protein
MSYSYIEELFIANNISNIDVNYTDDINYYISDNSTDSGLSIVNITMISVAFCVALAGLRYCAGSARVTPVSHEIEFDQV